MDEDDELEVFWPGGGFAEIIQLDGYDFGPDGRLVSETHAGIDGVVLTIDYLDDGTWAVAE